MSFSVLEHPFSVLERPFLLCPVLSRIPSRFLAVPARPVPDFGCPDPSRPLARFLACPVVPLSRDNEGTSVPLSLCPGTKKFCLSRCPFVPGQGQEQMSRDKLLCPGTSRDKMNFKIFKKKTRFSVLEHHFPALEHHFPVLEHPFLFQIIFFLF